MSPTGAHTCSDPLLSPVPRACGTWNLLAACMSPKPCFLPYLRLVCLRSRPSTQPLVEISTASHVTDGSTLAIVIISSDHLHPGAKRVDYHGICCLATETSCQRPSLSYLLDLYPHSRLTSYPLYSPCGNVRSFLLDAADRLTANRPT
jgi:hypothetical protein